MLAYGYADIGSCSQTILDAAEVASFHEGGREYRLACLVSMDELEMILLYGWMDGKAGKGEMGDVRREM